MCLQKIFCCSAENLKLNKDLTFSTFVEELKYYTYVDGLDAMWRIL